MKSGLGQAPGRYPKSDLNVLVNEGDYHPIASIIMMAIEKRVNFINRGLFEVKNLQADNFVAEKFAITTYARLLEGFMRDFSSIQSNVEVHVIQNTWASPAGERQIKVFESRGLPAYRLIFSPIDNPLNFSRGFAECGISFCLQSILPSTSSKKFENVFACFYGFKVQKFLYATPKGFALIEKKRLKAIQRKNSLIISVNMRSLESEYLNAQKLKDSRIKQIRMEESVVSDAFDMASGGVDAIIYTKVKVAEVLALSILVKSLTCFYSSNLDKIEDMNLLDEINFIAGNELIVKNFNS
jgi:fructose-1,6-bisphosphatase/inositol monophosphatase family enzyme